MSGDRDCSAVLYSRPSDYVRGGQRGSEIFILF